MHGTGQETLEREHNEACEALKKAINAVRNITVHGRDFDGDVVDAVLEYNAHVKALKSVENFIAAHLLHAKGFEDAEIVALAESLN